MKKLLVIVAALFFVPLCGLSMAAETQERSDAGVSVKVALDQKGGALTVKVSLNTHTVALDRYIFDEIVALRAGGKDYAARVKSEEGSGHHRSALIEFDKPGTNAVEIVVKDVAGVTERVFKFTL